MDMHYIQLNILKELVKNKESVFSKLNTEGLSNDQFNFHLKQLIKDKLVEKKDKIYSLTKAGLEFAGRIDVSTGNIIKQPKIGISLGVFRNNDTEVLLLKRKREQSLHKYTWLDRKWRFGKTSKQEIETLLLEEAGLSCSKFDFSGVAHIIRSDENTVEIDTVMHYFKVVDPKGELKLESRDGFNSWFSIDEAKKIDSDFKIASFDERLAAFIENKIIFQEYLNSEKV